MTDIGDTVRVGQFWRRPSGQVVVVCEARQRAGERQVRLVPIDMGDGKRKGWSSWKRADLVPLDLELMDGRYT